MLFYKSDFSLSHTAHFDESISEGLFQVKTEFDFRMLPLMIYFFQKFVLSKKT